MTGRLASRMVLIAVMAAGLAVLCGYLTHRARQPGYVVIDVCAAGEPTTAQVFFDTGDGFNESQSKVFRLRGHGLTDACWVPLPGPALRGLRLDPADRPGDVALTRIAWADRSGRCYAQVEPEAIRPLNQIESIRREGEGVRIRTTPDANDPQLALPVDLARSASDAMVFARHVAVRAFLALGVAGLLVLGLVNRLAQPLARMGRVLERAAASIGEPHLVVFDRGTLLVGALAVGLFAVAVIGKLHGSSVAIYDSVSEAGPSGSLVLGQPREVRSDEWAFLTPNILAQANAEPRFPVRNIALGGGATPMAIHVPVRHVTTLLRPHFLGFFVLDVERAFSLYWNLQTLLTFLGLFLLLKVLTGNRNGLSVLGALWFLFSSFTQWWWSAYPMYLVPWFLLAVLGALYVLLSTRRVGIGVGAGLMAVACVSFATNLYPPFQVPLAYLGALLVGVVVWPHRAIVVAPAFARFRVVAAALAAAVTGVMLVLFWRDLSETVRLAMQTVYPGRRVSTGGGWDVVRLLSTLWDGVYGEQRFPLRYGNVCEASGFVLLPVALLPLYARAALERHKGRIVDAALGLFMLALVVYMTVGVPEAIARLTGFSLVPSVRAMLPLGLASILLVTRLAALRDMPRRDLGWTACALAGLTASSVLVSVAFARERFLSVAEYGSVMILLGLVTFLFLAGKMKYALPVVVVALIAANGRINPVARGLAPIQRHPLYEETRTLLQGGARGRWIVYGTGMPCAMSAALLRAAGADVVSGTKNLPVARDMALLDPSGQYASIWNRYAHIACLAECGASNVVFCPVLNDVFTMTLDPRAPVLDQLGVAFHVFHGTAPPCVLEATNDFRLAFCAGPYQVYRRAFDRSVDDGVAEESMQP